MTEVFGFRTKDDICKIYHGKIHLAEDLCQRKRRLGHFRWHPEFIGREECVQYWVPMNLFAMSILQSSHLKLVPLSLFSRESIIFFLVGV